LVAQRKQTLHEAVTHHRKALKALGPVEK